MRHKKVWLILILNLLLLGENNAQVRGLLSSFMRAFAQRAENRRLHIRVDCDLMD